MTAPELGPEPRTIQSLTPEIEQTAGSVLKRYRRWTTREDLRQELWLFLLADTADQRRLVRDLKKADTDRRWMRSVMLKLRAVAVTYAEAEKAAASGYHPDDVFWYSPSKVATLLVDALDPEWAAESSGVGESSIGGSGLPEARSDRNAAVADIRKAIAGWSPAEIADLWELDHRFTDALNRIVSVLGGQHPHRVWVDSVRELEEAA